MTPESCIWVDKSWSQILICAERTVGTLWKNRVWSRGLAVTEPTTHQQGSPRRETFPQWEALRSSFNCGGWAKWWVSWKETGPEGQLVMGIHWFFSIKIFFFFFLFFFFCLGLPQFSYWKPHILGTPSFPDQLGRLITPLFCTKERKGSEEIKSQHRDAVYLKKKKQNHPLTVEQIIF